MSWFAVDSRVLECCPESAGGAQSSAASRWLGPCCTTADNLGTAGPDRADQKPGGVARLQMGNRESVFDEVILRGEAYSNPNPCIDPLTQPASPRKCPLHGPIHASHDNGLAQEP